MMRPHKTLDHDQRLTESLEGRGRGSPEQSGIRDVELGMAPGQRRNNDCETLITRYPGVVQSWGVGTSKENVKQAVAGRVARRVLSSAGADANRDSYVHRTLNTVRLSDFHDQMFAWSDFCARERGQDLNILSENEGSQSEESDEDRTEELHSGCRCRCLRVMRAQWKVVDPKGSTGLTLIAMNSISSR